MVHSKAVHGPVSYIFRDMRRYRYESRALFDVHFDAAVEAVVVGIFSNAVSTEKTRIMGLPYTGVANFGDVYNLATQYPSETNGQNSYCRR